MSKCQNLKVTAYSADWADGVPAAGGGGQSEHHEEGGGHPLRLPLPDLHLPGAPLRHHSMLSVVVWCVRRCPGCGAWWAPAWWRGPCWCPAPGSSCPAPAPSPGAAASQARPSTSRGCKADAENKFFGGCIHTQNIYLYLFYINFITHIDR